MGKTVKRSGIKKAIVLALLGLIAVLPALAFAKGPSTSAATYLNLGFGARPLAVGEAYVALADDASALHYNPAGLAFPGPVKTRNSDKSYEMLLSHSMRWVSDRSGAPLLLVSSCQRMI